MPCGIWSIHKRPIFYVFVVCTCMYSCSHVCACMWGGLFMHVEAKGLCQVSITLILRQGLSLIPIFSE